MNIVAGMVVKHKKRGGHYSVVGVGKMQSDDWVEYAGGGNFPSIDDAEVVIYRGLDGDKAGSIWVRPRKEFESGRFEEMS